MALQLSPACAYSGTEEHKCHQEPDVTNAITKKSPNYEFTGLVRDVNAWHSYALCFILTGGMEL